MTEKYFGPDGVLGRENRTPITPDLALKVGMAAGLAVRKSDDRRRVVVGKDTRLSGYMIENALVAGLTSVGMDVLVTGPIPTAAVAMLTHSMRCDLGIMVSVLDAPFEENGIRLFGADGTHLADDRLAAIESLIDSDVDGRRAEPPDLGRARRIDGAQDRYIEHAKGTLPRGFSLTGIRVVVDCANGAAYRVAPSALWELGAEVVAIGLHPDGLNINRPSAASGPAALAAKVIETGAQIGVGIDGDGGSLIVIDEKGEKLDGDQLLAVLARTWAEDGRLARQEIVATVMSNLGLERFLGGLGLSLLRAAADDRHIAEAMRCDGCNLGGDPSGNIILSDFAATGDALVAALHLIAIVKKLGRSVSETCRPFVPLPQIATSVNTGEGRPLDDSTVRKQLDDILGRLGDHGRLVVRASETEPVINVIAEGDSRAMTRSVVDEVVAVITDAAA